MIDADHSHLQSCYKSFTIFWLTNKTNSSYFTHQVGLAERAAVIGELQLHTKYYFQVSLSKKLNSVNITPSVGLFSSSQKCSQINNWCSVRRGLATPRVAVTLHTH